MIIDQHDDYSAVIYSDFQTTALAAAEPELSLHAEKVKLMQHLEKRKVTKS